MAHSISYWLWFSEASTPTEVIIPVTSENGVITYHCDDYYEGTKGLHTEQEVREFLRGTVLNDYGWGGVFDSKEITL